MRGRTRSLILLVTMALLLGSLAAVPAGAATDMHITSDTTLTQDFYGAVFIEADDVTLDCAGFTIYPDGENYQNGISVYGYDRVTVTNCVIDGGAQNVYAENVEDFHFIGNTVLNTYHWDGLRVHYGVRTVIEDNHAEGNARHGLTTGWGTDELYRDNTAVNNGSSGIAVGTGTVGVSLYGNVATGNGEIGFSSYGATGSYYEGNTATRNRLGFGMSAQTDLTLVGNNANRNTEIGFAMHNNSGVEYLNNKASSNGLAGFYTALMDDVLMRGNLAMNNGGEGFALWESTDFTIDSNVARNNFHGIVLGQGSDHKVTNNVITKSDRDGIILNDVHYSLVTGNSSDHNGQHGFAASNGATRNTFSFNSACKNGGWDAVDWNGWNLNLWTNNDFCTQYGF